jgi:membrane protease YdiL (CAAX protease family)
LKKSFWWLILLAGPVLFLIGIVLASLYYGFVTQGNSGAIPELVAASTPYQLIIIQVLLLLVLLRVMGREGLKWKDIGWKLAGGQKVWQEILIGALPGIALGFLYVFVLSPTLSVLQQRLGDYVPSGELFSTLGAAIIPFILANVFFAPFVEEGIYRGYAIPKLGARFGNTAAIVISCLFFGLLHWTGGFWYMLLTGAVAGGLFAGLFTARKNIIAPFAAHLAVNIVETLFIFFS